MTNKQVELINQAIEKVDKKYISVLYKMLKDKRENPSTDFQLGRISALLEIGSI